MKLLTKKTNQNDAYNYGAKSSKRSRTTIILIVLLVIMACSYAVFALTRPIESIGKPSLSPNVALNTTAITLPAYGQAAITVKDHGVVLASNNSKPQPTASVAKLITALAIVNKKPLATNQQGATITFTAADKEIYDSYVAKGVSVVKIHPGLQISQYQALQYILIPSANNIADSTAIWAFGSMQNYLDYANDLVKKLQLDSIIVADASGFSPRTVATANDLAKLGELALENPVIAKIVKQSSVILPDGSTKSSTNKYLGVADKNIVGIKTGNTDEAGAVFDTAAQRNIDGMDLTILATVMGGPSPQIAQDDAVQLIDQTDALLEYSTIYPAGYVVATYNTPWLENIQITAPSDINILSLGKTGIQNAIKLENLTPTTSSSQPIGRLTINTNIDKVEVPVYLPTDYHRPSTWWCLTHPL